MMFTAIDSTTQTSFSGPLIEFHIIQRLKGMVAWRKNTFKTLRAQQHGLQNISLFVVNMIKPAEPIKHCITDSVPAELLPNFSDKPSVPRSESVPSAALGPVLSEPESSVNTAGQQLVNS